MSMVRCKGVVQSEHARGISGVTLPPLGFRRLLKHNRMDAGGT